MLRFAVVAVACLAGVLVGQPREVRAQVAPPGTGTRVPGVPQASAADQEPRDDARLAGRVVAADSGRPLRRARVRLAAADSRLQRTASTDDEGRFSFGSLPAGRYALSASKAGYVGLEYGQRHARESGRILTLAGGERKDDADFRLPSGSVITVRVTDAFGEPFPGASVEVLQHRYTQNGERQLMPAETGQARVLTDDRGEARLYGLLPGDYVVSATPPESLNQVLREAGGSGAAYAPTFHPGAMQAADAVPVTVSAGQEAWAQIGILTTRLTSIRGTVVDSTGRPAAGATVRLAFEGDGRGRGQIRTRVGPDGAFMLDGVPPGDHVLVATGGGRGGGRGRGRGGPDPEFATVPVAVSSAPVEDLFVVIGTGATVTGRVRALGTSGDEPARLRIRTRPVDGTTAGIPGAAEPRSTTVEPDGTFRIDGLAGSVLFDVSPPDGWALASITLGGRDVTDVPVDLTGLTTVTDLVVTITDAVTRLGGSVSDGRGLPLHDGVVVIQPAERLEPVAASRRVRAIRLDEQGRFEASGLRPGRYVATAVATLESGAEYAPDVRERLRRRGRAFTLGDGEHATLSLELAAGP